jgi:nitrous oxidase accessory protein
MNGCFNKLVLLMLLSPAVVLAETLTPLQPLIDNAEEGSTLLLEPGGYAGPVLIDKPLTLDGQGKVTVDAGGKGSVIVVETDGAVIRNLHLTNSGESHNDIDSGVQVRGRFNVISDNVIDNCLFGIDLQQSENNIVRRNRISSKPFELGTRGDAIRLWYSFDNKVTDNIISDSRDTVVWYSANNTIARNTSYDSRYSLHFMYSRYNLVEENRYYNNTVGVFLMYSDGVVLRNNYIAHASGSTGVGIGFKETSDVTVEGNRILYCASGLYIDISPFQPDTINTFSNNLIAYNGIGIRFLNDWKGNEFRDNRFIDNLTQVVVSSGKTANRNVWEGNHWSDYEGFDEDRDGVGDTPYELYVYADRLWQDVPYAQFFKGSPVLEVMDFLERLAPFTEPRILVRDEQPSKQRILALVEEQTQVKDSLDILRESLGR